MKLWILAVVAALMVVGASAQECQCDTVKWASCTGPPCQCTIPLTKDINQPLNCNALAPKCFLMKTEMLRRSKGQDTRTVGKPEEGFVDNDGIYNPECESDGKFKAKQCNNTEECWCVNSAGVRRTEKEDKNIKCDKLNKFAPMVGSQKLNFTNILVYYVDAEPPTFKMNRLAGGVIAAIVVVLLIVAAGLLLLFFWNRRNKKYRKTQVRHFLSVFLGL
uniref:Epithelial cell adhesion molecule n=1 Tax=Oryzias latipes TaxID=8090 RepID=A0A3P9K001_ORYLA